jgi:hypothetical protein
VLAVFFSELSALRRQQVENRFRGPAQAHGFRRDNERPVDQDRMRAYCVEKHIVGKGSIAKTELVIRRTFLALNLTDCQAGAIKQLRQEQPSRRAFGIFDDVRFDSGISDHREYIA